MVDSQDPLPRYTRLGRLSARTGKPIAAPSREAAPPQDATFFDAARRVAQFLDQLRTHYRETRRAEVRIPADIRLLLDDGTLYDAGHAVVRNVSPSGALLADVVLPKQSYPVAAFRLEIVMRGGDYDGIGLEAAPIRFAPKAKGIGVRFVEFFVASE